ncbi:MAG: electron transfer flavoprotein subunit alpha/FixB family protein [Flavobacteriaceae bacterium]|nr:electron transfer flavoprotein subunit alpha/FixB family protein [Flavobacteriaceae bacterium]
MAVLVYTESEKGKFKKSAFELVSYAREIANKTNSSVTAISINTDESNLLSKYGADKVLNVIDTNLESFNAQLYSSVINQAALKESSKIIIIGSSANSKYLAPLLAIKLDAGYVSNVIEIPISFSPVTVKRTAFTNKAFEKTQINSEKALISLANNSFGLVENSSNMITEEFGVNLPQNNTSVISTDKASDKVTIADADTVVSAGRGLKGPENWGMVEELADVLGAATACSKPVSDLGWRPHGEHVGQTGKPVASNLYIAIGISGAIQHLAGINSSKIKVVINTDPEAPFFKAADYGVVGDAFEVVPNLINKLKTFKLQNS